MLTVLPPPPLPTHTNSNNNEGVRRKRWEVTVYDLDGDGFMHMHIPKLIKLHALSTESFLWVNQTSKKVVKQNLPDRVTWNGTKSTHSFNNTLLSDVCIPAQGQVCSMLFFNV